MTLTTAEQSILRQRPRLLHGLVSRRSNVLDIAAEQGIGPTLHWMAEEYLEPGDESDEDSLDARVIMHRYCTSRATQGGMVAAFGDLLRELEELTPSRSSEDRLAQAVIQTARDGGRHG